MKLIKKKLEAKTSPRHSRVAVKLLVTERAFVSWS